MNNTEIKNLSSDDEWFTIEKIDNETYAISEYGHWEKAHSYLLIGKNNALLIDTGLGIGNIKKEIQKLTNLPIIVVTTHIHWDHIGGHNLFDTIYVYEDEADWLKNGIGIPLNVIKKNVMAQPFTKKPPAEFNIDNYKIYSGNPDKMLKDNDIIDIGKRKIKEAFQSIQDRNMLKQGTGTFDFYEFKIKM